MRTRHPQVESPRTATRLIAVIGALLVIAYAVLAAVQILVLNPLAAVPGTPLAQIHAETDAANQSLGQPVTIAILGVGVLLALAGIVIAVTVVPTIAPERVAMGYLALLVLGVPAYFAASFAPGMSLADTYGIGGADVSPWVGVLYTVSLAALAALLIVAVTASIRRRRVPLQF